jgi:hypothetical protein
MRRRRKNPEWFPWLFGGSVLAFLLYQSSTSANPVSPSNPQTLSQANGLGWSQMNTGTCSNGTSWIAMSPPGWATVSSQWSYFNSTTGALLSLGAQPC